MYIRNTYCQQSEFLKQQKEKIYGPHIIQPCISYNKPYNPGCVVNRFYIVSLGVQQFQLEEEKFVLYDSCHRRSFHNKSSTFITKFTSNLPKGRKEKINKGNSNISNKKCSRLLKRGRRGESPLPN